MTSPETGPPVEAGVPDPWASPGPWEVRCPPPQAPFAAGAPPPSVPSPAVELASLGRRLAARLIDVTVVTVVAVVVAVATAALIGAGLGLWESTALNIVKAVLAWTLAVSLAGVFALLASGVAQFGVVILPTAVSGQSLGKAITGIQVHAASGRGWRALIREVTPILIGVGWLVLDWTVLSATVDVSVLQDDSPASVAFLAVAPVPLLLDLAPLLLGRRRCLHDLYSGTIVILSTPHPSGHT